MVPYLTPIVAHELVNYICNLYSLSLLSLFLALPPPPPPPTHTHIFCFCSSHLHSMWTHLSISISGGVLFLFSLSFLSSPQVKYLRQKAASYEPWLWTQTMWVPTQTWPTSAASRRGGLRPRSTTGRLYLEDPKMGSFTITWDSLVRSWAPLQTLK